MTKEQFEEILSKINSTSSLTEYQKSDLRAQVFAKFLDGIEIVE